MTHTSNERATETVLFAGMCARNTSPSQTVGGLDSRKPSSPTYSGSNTIRFWSPTSSTGAGTAFATVRSSTTSGMTAQSRHLPSQEAFSSPAFFLPVFSHA
ncbi:hypothetical protein TNCV_2097501 [Trichonephila clavipes]|nr:hypothetical protein TNCV_2097501 [Trichonephila clavipes]